MSDKENGAQDGNARRIEAVRGKKPEKRAPKPRVRVCKTEWGPEIERRFLEALARRGIIQDALEASGVTRDAVKHRRAKEAKFAAACEQAIETSNDKIRAVNWKLGVEGISKPIYRRGIQVGEELAWDMSAMQYTMRDRGLGGFGRMELTGAGKEPITIKVVE